MAQGTTFDLEAQLALAAEVQRGLLPKPYCCIAGWETAFSYEPAGHTSGDHLDLIPDGDNAFYFILGDVSGKGIAASLLMSHLHATVRGLLTSNLTIEEAVRETSRLFCHTSLPAQFATLVLGHASSSGEVRLVNAGHTPVLLAAMEGLLTWSQLASRLGCFAATNSQRRASMWARVTCCSSIPMASARRKTARVLNTEFVHRACAEETRAGQSWRSHRPAQQ